MRRANGRLKSLSVNMVQHHVTLCKINTYIEFEDYRIGIVYTVYMLCMHHIVCRIQYTSSILSIIIYRIFDLLYSIYIVVIYHRMSSPGEAACNTCDPSQLHISSHFPWVAGQVETTLTPVDIGKTIAISPAFHLWKSPRMEFIELWRKICKNQIKPVLKKLLNANNAITLLWYSNTWDVVWYYHLILQDVGDPCFVWAHWLTREKL